MGIVLVSSLVVEWSMEEEWCTVGGEGGGGIVFEEKRNMRIPAWNFFEDMRTSFGILLKKEIM